MKDEHVPERRGAQLHPDEKVLVWKQVRQFMDAHPLPPPTAWLELLTQRMFVWGAALLFIVSVCVRMSDTVTASLPGDTLYPLKIHVMEQMQSALNAAPRDRIAWEQTRLGERLHEAHALAERNQLTPVVAQELSRGVEGQIDSLAAAADQLERDNGVSDSVLRRRLSSALESHEKQFQRLLRRDDLNPGVGPLIEHLKIVRQELEQGTVPEIPSSVPSAEATKSSVSSLTTGSTLTVRNSKPISGSGAVQRRHSFYKSD